MSGNLTKRERTPEEIGVEVRNLTGAAQAMTLWYAVEIGRRLCEAKELIPHGGWLDWLKSETEFSQPKANRLMRVFEEYGAEQGCLFGAEVKYSTLNNLSFSKALALLAVPDEERESFAAEVGAEALSTRDLEAAIRERDQARRALQTSEARLEDTQRTLAGASQQISELRERLTQAQADVEAADAEAERKERALRVQIAGLEKSVAELEARPVEVAVMEPDPAEVERRAEELVEGKIAEVRNEAEQRVKAAERQEKNADDAAKRATEAREKAEAAARETEKKLRDKIAELEKGLEEAKEAAGAVEDAGPYRAKVEDLQRRLAMADGGVVAFRLRFEAWQQDYAAMMAALEGVAEEKRASCRAAVAAVIGGWSNGEV